MAALASPTAATGPAFRGAGGGTRGRAGRWRLGAHRTLPLPAHRSAGPAQSYMCSHGWGWTASGATSIPRCRRSARWRAWIRRQASVTPFVEWWDPRSGKPVHAKLGGVTGRARGRDSAALVWANSPREIADVLVNLSQATGMIVAGIAPTVVVDAVSVPLTISGATAEWIVEWPTAAGWRPWVVRLSGLWSRRFHECWAATAAAPGVPAGLPI